MTGRSLGRAATRGAVATLTGQGLRLLVQLAGVVVLARLLGPSDYGLVAIVAVLIGLGEVFRDFGLSSAAIQAKDLGTGERSNLFWANTGIGLVLAVLGCGAAPILGAVFGDARLVPLTVAMSATFVINGLAAQYRAGLARGLRFLALTTVETIAQLGGVVLGVVAAVAGAGAWALAGQQLGQAALALVLLVAVGGWLPGLPSRRVSIRRFVGFGSNLLGVQLLVYLTRNIDTAVIGARFGAAPLGVYSRAFQLVSMPLLQLQAPSTRVALPILSRLQDQRERFAEFVVLGQFALLTIVGATFAILGSQAPAVVRLALGDRWADAVPLLRLLLVAGFFQAATYATYWVFLAKGLARANLHYALATRPLVALMIAGGSIWGVTGVAVAVAVSSLLVWPVALLWIGRVSDAPAGAMFFNGLRTLAVFGVATAASIVATLPLAGRGDVLEVVVGVVAVVLVAGLAALLWPRFRQDLRAVVGLRRHLRRERPGAVVAA